MNAAKELVSAETLQIAYLLPAKLSFNIVLLWKLWSGQVEGGEEGEEEEPVELHTVKKQLLESSWCGLLSALGIFFIFQPIPDAKVWTVLE